MSSEHALDSQVHAPVAPRAHAQGKLLAKFGRRFSSFFCWGKLSEAFSTKTPPQISPSNFTTRFWVVAGPYKFLVGISLKRLHSCIESLSAPLQERMSCQSFLAPTALSVPNYCITAPYFFGQLILGAVTQRLHSETGRIRFRGVRFQTPNSVSFLGLTEFRGANSVSSFQPIIYV